MGNMHGGPSPGHGCIRVVHANGSVQDLLSPLAAAEVVQWQHENIRNFLLCSSRSLRVGKRPCPVHPDAQLELGHLYFVLPVRTFQSRLAWSQISSLAATATARPAAANNSPRNSHVGAKRAARRLAATKMIVRILFCRRATLVRVARERGEYASQGCLAPTEPALTAAPNSINICDTPQGQIKYIDQLIARSNSWRPQLRTIEEFLAV